MATKLNLKKARSEELHNMAIIAISGIRCCCDPANHQKRLAFIIDCLLELEDRGEDLYSSTRQDADRLMALHYRAGKGLAIDSRDVKGVSLYYDSVSIGHDTRHSVMEDFIEEQFKAYNLPSICVEMARTIFETQKVRLK